MVKSTDFAREKSDLLDGKLGVVRVYFHDKLKTEVGLSHKPLIFGRSAKCDVILSQAGISRLHAKLRCGDGKVVLEDMGSAHGTLFQGSPVRTQELRSRDAFSIGPYEIRYLSASDYAAEQRAQDFGASTLAGTSDSSQRRFGDRRAGSIGQGLESAAGVAPGRFFEGTTLLAEALGVVRDRWRLIAGCVAGALVFGLIHTIVAVPMYEADALVEVEPKIREIGGPFADLEDHRRFNDALVDELQVLQSRRVLGEVVENLGLSIRSAPLFFPGFGSDFGLTKIGSTIARLRADDGLVEPLFGMNQFAWSDERIVVDSMEIPDDFIWSGFRVIADGKGGYDIVDVDDNVLATGEVGTPLIDWLPIEETSSLFISELKANEGTVFKLRKLPHLAAIQRLRASLIITDAGIESSMLRLSIADKNPALAATILNELTSAYVGQNVQKQTDDAIRTLRFVERQIPLAKEKMEIAEGKLNEMRLERGSVDLPSDTQVVLDRIVRLESQLSGLEQSRVLLLERFTSQHPRVRSLDAQISSLNQDISSTESRVRDLPTTQREVVSLSRDVAVASELYLSLVNRAEMLGVVSAYAATKGNVRVVDDASVPLFPFRPNKGFLLTLYLMLGLALSAGLILFERQLRNVVHDPELVEARLNLPIYATLPHSSQQDTRNKQPADSRGPILAKSSPGDHAIEGLRSLRTSLQFAFVNAHNNILLITGPTAGIGKTFVAANLGAVLAASGRTVVVVDADLRRGVLHSQFNIPREPGLADAISGDVELRDITNETDIDGLYAVTAGARPPNPSELLMHQRFIAQLEDLSTRFDHVIIDSPPVLAVTDSSLVSRLAGVVLLVVKSGVHPMREIEQTVKRLVRVGANIRGVVFNDMPQSAGSVYGYGSYDEKTGQAGAT